MKSITLFIALLVLLSTPASALSPNTMADVAKAQVIINKAMQIATQFAKYTITLEAPKPQDNTRGQYLLPYDKNGMLTEWAQKALQAKIGAAAGEKAGDMASNTVASKVPFGGLAKGFMKKKAKETGAMVAVGGAKFIKQTSSMSFNDINDYALYMHVKHGSSGGYTEALAAAMAIYPDLEQHYDVAINQAYRRALTKR